MGFKRAQGGSKVIPHAVQVLIKEGGYDMIYWR
jgi:hypothetical protein